jgi:hypothetical protein
MGLRIGRFELVLIQWMRPIPEVVVVQVVVDVLRVVAVGFLGVLNLALVA